MRSRLERLGVLAISGKESKHLGEKRRVGARLKGGIASVGAEGMWAEWRGGRDISELRISHF